MPVETNNGDFPMRLILPLQKVRKTFRSAEEVKEFLQSEIEYWQELYQSVHRLPHYQQPPTPGFIARATYEPFRNASSQGLQPNSALEELERHGAIISDGTLGIFCRETHDRSPDAYLGAVLLAAASLRPLSDFHDLGQQRVVLNNLYSAMAGIAPLVEARKTNSAEQKILGDLISDTQDARDEAEGLRIAIAEWQAKHQEDTKDAATTFSADMSSLIEKATSELNTSLEQSNAKIEELEKKVRERLILEAPTTYWTKKASGHQRVAGIFGAIFLATLVGSVLWLTHYGVDLVSEAYTKIVGADRANTGLLALVPLAFITLPTLAVAWLLRHVSRVIVQSMSLGADARLRGTIATTYGALTVDRPGSEAELAIALNALFRPIDGSAHAEISPPNIRDVMEMTKG